MDEKKFNGIIQTVVGIRPQDQIETMLASQMAAAHAATMDQARRLLHSSGVEARYMVEKAVNRLARTFATQVEALKRYRSTAEQRITVQHVNVEGGGQPCQSPAVTGWKVCRHHGAGGGAPKGERNGDYRHGLYTQEAKAERREMAALLKMARSLMSSL